MAINFGTKGRFRELKDIITTLGYKREHDGVHLFKAGTEAIIQNVIDSYNPLPDLRKKKVDELKAEGLSRIQVIFPAVNNFDELDLIREQWLSIAPAARQATADFQRMIDIVQAGRSARQAIIALNTIAEIESYDVVNAPSWPV